MSSETRRIFRFTLHALNLTIPLGTTLAGVVAWRNLPERVPIHFNISGQADRWTGKGGELALLFFILPWIGTLLMYGGALLTRWSFAHPKWVNLPQKKAFFKLPPERQREFRDMVVEFLWALGAAVNLLLMSAVLAVIKIALGNGSILPWWGIWPCLGLVLLVAGGYTGWLLRATWHITHPRP